MEPEEAFAERWKVEYMVKLARTASWLLHHADSPSLSCQRTVTPWLGNRKKKEMSLADNSAEIDWNHPRMGEALKIYFHHNLRFDDTVNLNQEKAPGCLDIDPDFWPEVSTILRQLKHRDVSADFGMARFCPQFSSMDIDKVSSTSYPGYHGELSPIALTPAPRYQDEICKVQYGFKEGLEEVSAACFDRVVSPHLKNSQATYYHEYARRMFPESVSRAEKYRDLAVQYSMGEQHQQPKRNGRGQTDSEYVDDLNSSLSPLIRNPLLHGLIRHNETVRFVGDSVIRYTRTDQEKAWEKIPYGMDFSEVYSKMIRDISLKELTRENTLYRDRTDCAPCTILTSVSLEASVDLISTMQPTVTNKTGENTDSLQHAKPVEHAPNSLRAEHQCGSLLKDKIFPTPDNGQTGKSRNFVPSLNQKAQMEPFETGATGDEVRQTGQINPVRGTTYHGVIEGPHDSNRLRNELSQDQNGTTSGQKEKRVNFKLIRYCRRKVSHFKSRMKSLNCRSSTKCT